MGAGLPIVLEAVVEVVYRDGYVTFGSMLLPAGPPPNCGWPLVVHVHPLGSSRVHDLGLQQRIAAAGYAVWSYDVRGQGAALLEPRNSAHPARGTTLWGPVERFDLAEQIHFVANRPAFQGVVDVSRTAVIGSSQGGVHAWNAVAFSGQQLALPGRGTLAMPLVRCAVANDYVAEPVLDWLREEALFSSWFVNQITDDAVHFGFALDEAFHQTAAAAFRAQDPQALLQAFAAEGRRIDGGLLASTVPVLYSHAYHDLIDSPMPTLAVLQAMTAPARALLSTIGHNTPDNHHERAFRDQVLLRWLERWLWDESNEVELEPPFVLSAMPLDRTLREDPYHPWSRLHGGDPLAPPVLQRLHLHDDGTLQPQEPAAPQPPAVIDHGVLDPAFTAEAYLAAAPQRELGAVLQAIPLSERVYATMPLSSEMDLAQSAALHLVVTPTAPRWMLAALLTVQPDGGEEVMLSSQAVARLHGTPGAAIAVDLALPPVAARLPAGTVIRLRLRNHWLRESPMERHLEVAPLFQPFQVAIAHGPAASGSWFDLPLVAPRPALVVSTVELDLGTMAPLPLRVRGGSARAGKAYFMTASVSGQLPGAPYLNDVVPLEVDWLTGIVTVSTRLPEFRGFLGLLDGHGEATAVLDLSAYAPFDPALSGLRLTFAGFVWDDVLASSGAASNPVDVILR